MSHQSKSTYRAAALAVCIALLVAAAPAAALPTLMPSVTVAGPSSQIVGLGGLSIGRDGTGGLIYTLSNGGVTNVYVSRLLGGSFGPPEQVDAGLAGSSSQPVIAATNGGLLVVAFINGGQLYVNQVPNTTTSFPPPTPIAGGAQSPAIAISTFGKAYVAFTASGDGGSDVRCAYYDAGTWGLETTALNVTPGDNAGVGLGRPAVATAGDGVGIVAWGESGHIFTRRVSGTQPSTDVEQADPASVSGWQEVSADEPSLGAGGDSSYVTVGYRETVQSGGQTQTRVLMSRLIAGQYQPAVGADGLATPDADSADQPSVAIGEFGSGFVLSERTTSHELFALPLQNNGIPSPVIRVDSQTNSGAPMAVGGIAGLTSVLLAWQEQSTDGTTEIRVIFGTDGGALGAEQVASNPLLGSTDAADGLAASGDGEGDTAAAWIQGSGPSARIVAAQLYAAPGYVGIVHVPYTNNPQPTFTWRPSREDWGPVTYALSLNGTVVATTTSTSFRPSSPLADGAYTWRVTPTNQVGLIASSGTATIHIDTLAPRVQVTVGGRQIAGSAVRLHVTVTDVRPGQPASASSGIQSVVVNWGDGASSRITANQSHVYARAGLYRVTVTAVDHAGNSATVTRYLRILAPPATGRHRRLP